jgi:putative FmdB family regulatory protein
MPIYEYQCPACNAAFEELVRSERAARRVVCPKCGHRDVTRRMSTFATHVAPDRPTPAAGPCASCCGADGSCPLGK